MYTYQPLVRTPNIPSRNPRNTIPIGNVWVDRLDCNIPRVNRKQLPAKSHRHTRIRAARDGEPSLAIRLRTRDGVVDRICVSLGRDDQRCAGIEDSGASGQSEIIPVDGDGIDCSLPEAVRVDVGEANKCLGIEFGRVKPSGGMDK
jgi:hypothetical protein